MWGKLQLASAGTADRRSIVADRWRHAWSAMRMSALWAEAS
jgi:hypothetical protein